MAHIAHEDLGIAIPDILLPKKGTDMEKWAVVACDQFTSQPDYWSKVDALVGTSPSTLRLVFPEAYLGKGEDGIRITQIHSAMRRYLDHHLFTSHAGAILVQRQSEHHGKSHTRTGLMLALDLEHYDYAKGSESLIRATEGTIVERLPPRIRIRENAPLELPHIMVLIDDPGKSVIEPLAHAPGLTSLYDFDLMMGSGHLNGSLVGEAALATSLRALEQLRDPAEFSRRYKLIDGKGVLLFAVGDGNHSLATAKAIWTKIKEQAPDPVAVLSHPARYALVEVVNVHDPGLDFEPIHRILFEMHEDFAQAIAGELAGDAAIEDCKDATDMMRKVDHPAGSRQVVGFVSAAGCKTLTFRKPCANLAVGTLQAFLDGFVKRGGCKEIDYVHGSDVVLSLGAKPGNAGFYLPAMDKRELFRTVILDGALPRKTFSMGEASEKRFYCEARRILP